MFCMHKRKSSFSLDKGLVKEIQKEVAERVKVCLIFFIFITILQQHIFFNLIYFLISNNHYLLSFVIPLMASSKDDLILLHEGFTI